jgi:topoisomerase-4 subunit B
MYIGKLGDGSSFDDGIYILLKEVLDNCIDEFVMGHGKKVEVTIEGQRVEVRDYGRGVPLGKVIDVVSKINTGAKYDSKAFKKSVGLNGVGTKAVNAFSGYFKIESVRDGQLKRAEFDRGVLRKDEKLVKTDEANGTRVVFEPDEQMFKQLPVPRAAHRAVALELLLPEHRPHHPLQRPEVPEQERLLDLLGKRWTASRSTRSST